MCGRILAVLALALAVALPIVAQDPSVIKVGVADSRANELSSGQKMFIDVEFPKMVEEFTGLKSKLEIGGGPLAVVKKLDAKELHMAIFQGVELAWARNKEPKMKPLMLAIYRTPVIHAQLVAKKDAKIKSVDELKGKNIVMLSKDHCELFADKLVKGSAKGFFGKIATTTNVESALDDVLLGKVSAAMVDNAGMDVYKDVNPGRFARLKVIVQSEQFPSPAIAYHEGNLTTKTVNSFKTGMLKANKSEKGREAMANFQITSFAPVPADYEKQLDAILKAYPPPKE